MEAQQNHKCSRSHVLRPPFGSSDFDRKRWMVVKQVHMKRKGFVGAIISGHKWQVVVKLGGHKTQVPPFQVMQPQRKRDHCIVAYILNDCSVCSFDLQLYPFTMLALVAFYPHPLIRWRLVRSCPKTYSLGDCALSPSAFLSASFNEVCTNSFAGVELVL